MPRQIAGETARVYYPTNWPWPDKPWPWCRWAEHTDGTGHVQPAVPHHAHMVNEGNTECPGVPGIIPEGLND